MLNLDWRRRRRNYPKTPSRLTVHHLGKSQSERIVWLCEELGIAYDLKIYERDPATLLAPPDYKALHPAETAPVIVDGDVVLAESGAVVDYIIARHGGGRLTLPADHPDYPHYLYWVHAANASLLPSLMRDRLLATLDAPAGNPLVDAMKARLARHLRLVEARLGEAPWFAGRTFTSADIFMVFCLTTLRYFAPLDLTPYPNIRAYLQRIAARPAYRRAMAKGDPGMPLLLT